MSEKRKKKIAVFVSGSETNYQALQEKVNEGYLDAKIVLVLSDRDNVMGLERAEKFGVPTAVVNYKKCIQMVKKLGDECPLPPDFDLKRTMDEAKSLVSKRWDMANDEERSRAERFFKARAIAEREIWEIIEPLNVDIIVLAGFMQILTPYFQKKFQPNPMHLRIINIHPAILPAFPGEHGYEDTFYNGNPIGGSTVHYVDADEDTGPIIGQAVFLRYKGMTISEFKERGLSVEYKLYWRCVQRHIEGRTKIIINEKGKRVVENPFSIMS